MPCDRCFSRTLGWAPQSTLRPVTGCLPWGILSASPAPWYKVPSLNRSKTYPGLCTDSRQEATRQGWFPAQTAGWEWTGARSTHCRERREGPREGGAAGPPCLSNTCCPLQEGGTPTTAPPGWPIQNASVFTKTFCKAQENSRNLDSVTAFLTTPLKPLDLTRPSGFSQGCYICKMQETQGCIYKNAYFLWRNQILCPFFWCDLYTQCGAQPHDPKMESCMLNKLSQPRVLSIFLFLFF